MAVEVDGPFHYTHSGLQTGNTILQTKTREALGLFLVRLKLDVTDYIQEVREKLAMPATPIAVMPERKRKERPTQPRNPRYEVDTRDWRARKT